MLLGSLSAEPYELMGRVGNCSFRAAWMDLGFGRKEEGYCRISHRASSSKALQTIQPLAASLSLAIGAEPPTPSLAYSGPPISKALRSLLDWNPPVL
jgi:hypothetical protein